MAGFLDTIFNWLPKLRKPDLTLADAQCDSAGNLLVAIASSSSSNTTWSDPQAGTPLTYKKQIASTAKLLYLAMFENTSVATRWVMFFDRTAAPTAGLEPVFAFPVLEGQSVMFQLPRPRQFANGIWWGISSTAGTYSEDSSALFRVSCEVG